MTPWRRSLIVLWSANFVTAVGMMMVIPFFPLYLRELGVADGREVTQWTGLVVGAAPFSAAFMGGVWGALSDQVGRRAMVVRALLGIAVFVGLMGFARTPVQLLLLRFGQGVFSGFFAPSLTLVSVLAPREVQGRISSWLQSSFLAGSVAGPAIGGLLATRVGFSVMLWICSGLAVVSVITVRSLVPEPPLEREPKAERGPDVPGAVVTILRRVFRELAQVLANPFLRRLFLALFLVRLAVAAFNPTLILFVEHLMGGKSDAAAHAAAVIFTAYPAATLLALPFWGRASDLSSPRRVLLFCTVCGAILTAAQALAATPWQIGVLRFLTGIFLAGVFPAGFALVATTSDNAHRGGTTGLAFSALAFGLAFGPWMTSIVDGLFGYRVLVVVCGLLVVLAFLRTAIEPRVRERAS